MAPSDIDGGSVAGKELEEPTGDLSLREALVLALRGNPQLAVFSWEVRAREAEALQAGLLPNPALGIEVESFAGSGEFRALKEAETTISLSQLLELGGKRGRRRQAAQLERDLALWDYEVARVDILTEVGKAFIGVLAAQQKVGLAEELVRVAEQAERSVSRRVQAGAVSPVEETRARVEAATSRLDLRIAQRDLAVERKRLAALWGSSSPRFARAVGELRETGAPPDLEVLLDRIDANPEIARWTTELERRRADVALQSSLGVPDLEIQAGFRRLGGSWDNAMVAGLGLSVPLFDRNQGARRAARIRVNQTEELRRRAQVAVAAALGVVYENLAAAHADVVALEDEILPEAETASETAREAYGKGLFRLTDVLDTQRTLFELRWRHFDALAAYHQSVADIERLIGQPLAGGSDANE